MNTYDILIGLILIVLGLIPVIDKEDRDQKGLANAMYRYGGIGLIVYGVIYIIYTISN